MSSSLAKAEESHKKLLKSASKFLSPSFKEYFMAKANEDYGDFVSNPQKTESLVERYMKKTNEMNDSLERVVGIYNTYRDPYSTL